METSHTSVSSLAGHVYKHKIWEFVHYCVGEAFDTIIICLGLEMAESRDKMLATTLVISILITDL